MGFPPPQFNTPLAPDQINPELPFYPIYGVTPSDKYIPISIDSMGRMNVNATLSGSVTIGEIGAPDESNFSYGASLQQPIGGVYQDTNPTLSAGEQGVVRLTQYRAFHVNLRDSLGNEIVSTAGSLDVHVTGTSNSGTPYNQYEENNAVPPGESTTLWSYTVPVGESFQFNGFVGWGTYDGEFTVTVNAANAGGGWSSPTNRTLIVNYVPSPIVLAAGDQIAVLITQYSVSSQTFKINILATLVP
ncbi:MAG: hypothetical protein ACREBR_05795 [bacterium]